MDKTLIEFREEGGCVGCEHYEEVEKGRMECTFPWFDDDTIEWEFSKNCDNMEK